MAAREQLIAEIEAVFERLLKQQRDKVKEVALDILPHLSSEQMQDPHDYPEVVEDTIFNFEDGFLAGLLSARMALRTNVFAEQRPSAG
jgi:hypothetical protein